MFSQCKDVISPQPTTPWWGHATLAHIDAIETPQRDGGRNGCRHQHYNIVPVYKDLEKIYGKITQEMDGMDFVRYVDDVRRDVTPSMILLQCREWAKIVTFYFITTSLLNNNKQSPAIQIRSRNMLNTSTTNLNTSGWIHRYQGKISTFVTCFNYAILVASKICWLWSLHCCKHTYVGVDLFLSF